VKTWRLHPVVEAVQALRGLDLTGAVTLIAEVGDLTRFDTPRKLMSYLGLTPTGYSSLETCRDEPPLAEKLRRHWIGAHALHATQRAAGEALRRAAPGEAASWSLVDRPSSSRMPSIRA
jgi:transposase